MLLKSEHSNETGLAVALDFKAEDDEGVFRGYASTFGNVDEGGDIVMPGAYAKSLQKRGAKGVKMFWQHDSRELLGMWEEIEEDKRGLKVKGRLLLSVQRAKEIYEFMKAGAIDSLSVGYRTIKSTFDTTTNTRSLLEVDLWEISPVTFPMNPKARIQGVKGDIVLPTRKEIEAALRNDGGFSHADSRKAAAVLKGLLRNGEDETVQPLRHAAGQAITRGLDDVLRAIRS